MKLSEVAAALHARLDSPNADLDIKGVAGIEEAGPGELTFVANPRYAKAARTTKASAVIVSEDFPQISAATLRSGNPYLAFAHAVELFYQPPMYAAGVHPTAVVHGSAKIGKNASIGPYVVIDEGVVIGDDCVLLAHVVIYRNVRIGNNFFAHAHAVVREHCRLGNRVVLQNGAVVGADGFGFAKDDTGHWHKIVQSGVAIVDDDVEVQANACVDRASIGETHIGRGTKLDNMVHVGHGCTVGEDTLLCAQVGLAGSTEIGNKVVLAGQVGVAGHCKVGDGVIAIAQSGLPGDVEPGRMISGAPAIDFKQWRRCIAVYERLPELAKAVRELKGQKSEE